MIVNLQGPPAAGKTFYATKLLKDFPYFKHHQYDTYRLKYTDENKVWEELIDAILLSEFCVLESSGTSWRLKEFIFDHPGIKNKHKKIMNVIFYAKDEELHRRLTERHKRDSKFWNSEAVAKNFRKSDEHMAVSYCLDYLFQIEQDPAPIYIKTDTGKSIDEIYNNFRGIVSREIDKEENKKCQQNFLRTSKSIQ